MGRILYWGEKNPVVSMETNTKRKVAHLLEAGVLHRGHVVLEGGIPQDNCTFTGLHVECVCVCTCECVRACGVSVCVCGVCTCVCVVYARVCVCGVCTCVCVWCMHVCVCVHVE